jgi:hypothetical protein
MNGELKHKNTERKKYYTYKTGALTNDSKANNEIIYIGP